MVVVALPTKRFWAFCAALECAIHGKDTFEDATAVVVMLDGDGKREREREGKSRDIYYLDFEKKVTLNPEKKSAFVGVK